MPCLQGPYVRQLPIIWKQSIKKSNPNNSLPTDCINLRSKISKVWDRAPNQAPLSLTGTVRV